MKHRTEQQMMDLILGVAERDERVRAVWINGSRANPNAPRDQYQDFDIVYAVTDMQSMIDEPGWIDIFGERVIMQTRADQLDSDPPYEDWYDAAFGRQPDRPDAGASGAGGGSGAVGLPLPGFAG